jgi:hypothetical protein
MKIRRRSVFIGSWNFGVFGVVMFLVGETGDICAAAFLSLMFGGRLRVTVLFKKRIGPLICAVLFIAKSAFGSLL